jgi:beta-mannosidase
MSTKTLKLNGEWLYKTEEKAKFSRVMRVPCNWEVGGLHDHSGVVWFKKKWLGVRGKGLEKEYILRFKGVDYFADVWLNGKYVGHHEGYFQPFEFNVTKHILKGINTLIVKVNSPKEDPKDWPHDKRYIKGVFGHHDVRPGGWSPKYGQMMGTGGIWNDVELIVTDGIRVKGVKVVSKLSGLVKAVLEVENYVGRPVVADIVARIHESGGSKKAQKKIRIRLKPGLNTIKTQLKIKNPKLWWTWDLGKQTLYEAKVAVEVKNVMEVKDVKAVRFGIREIRKDKGGNWLLNGRRVFVRGTNIIPEEYLSTYTKERIAKDILLLKEANVNAVRVHAHVNREEFYKACDEAGIMVWQDFALQWEYKDTPAFKKEAVKQIKDMVNLLYNHPSIVLWGCHNESIKGKKSLDKLLFNAVRSLDSTRLVMPSSDFNEHPYPGWFWGKMEYFFAMPGGVLPSEFGAMALPNLAALKKMFEPKDLWPPNWIKWAKKDFTYEQMFHIAKVRKGTSIFEFINNSQDYQAKMIKFVIELYRLKKFIGAAGIFHFMFLEPWPCISYSVVDYYRAPKRGFYALKAAFQPLIVIANLNRDIFGLTRKIEGEFYVVNDREEQLKGLKLLVRILRGKRAVHSFAPVHFAAEKNCCKYITPDVYSSTHGLKIPGKLLPGFYSLVFDVFKGKAKLSSNSYDIKLEKMPDGLLEFNARFNWE